MYIIHIYYDISYKICLSEIVQRRIEYTHALYTHQSKSRQSTHTHKMYGLYLKPTVYIHNIGILVWVVNHGNGIHITYYITLCICTQDRSLPLYI